MQEFFTEVGISGKIYFWEATQKSPDDEGRVRKTKSEKNQQNS